MIKTTAMLLEELKNYASPKDKLARMVERGKCFPVVKGVYETDRNVPAYLLAGSIYGPSYISFEYALSHYGLIPEAVYTVTCATFEKKKKKYYETTFGNFSYRDVPSKAFPLGIQLERSGAYYYRIATPEKALCDELYVFPPVSNVNSLLRLLTEDLRIEESDLKKLNRETVVGYADAYRSTNVKRMGTLLRRIQK